MKNKTTKKGFVQNGMLDEVTELYPDIYKMMQTCKSTDIKQEYKCLLFKHFWILYQTMKDRGDIPESLHRGLGFLSDANYARKYIDKLNNILSKIWHFAKLVNHQLQRNLHCKKEKDTLDLDNKKIQYGNIMIETYSKQTTNVW